MGRAASAARAAAWASTFALGSAPRRASSVAEARTHVGATAGRATFASATRPAPARRTGAPGPPPAPPRAAGAPPPRGGEGRPPPAGRAPPPRRSERDGGAVDEQRAH